MKKGLIATQPGNGIGGTNIKRQHFYIIALLMLALIVISVLYFDRPIARAMPGAPKELRNFYEVLTDLGKSDIYLIPTLVLSLFFWWRAKKSKLLCARYRAAKNAAINAYLFGAVALSGMVVNVFKFSIGRPRPRLLLREDNFSMLEPFSATTLYRSFPSGHTNTAFAIALALAFFFPRWRLPLLLVAAMVGVSRLAVGAHYLSDIIAGAFIAYLTTYALRGWWEKKYRLPF